MTPLAATVVVRAADRADASAIAGIYNHGIAERAATFDTDEVTDVEVFAWVADGRQPMLDRRVGRRLLDALVAAAGAG